MFFKPKTELNSTEYEIKLDAFFGILKKFPADEENFLESLRHFLSLLDASSGSVYLFEEKTRLFLLKRWYGDEPAHFSISENYELIQYVKSRAEIVHKSDFTSNSASELRQPALFYFQNTAATVICPIFQKEKCLALVHVYLPEQSKSQINLKSHLIKLYGEQIKNFLIHHHLQQENKKLSEVSHVKNQLLANVTHELQTPLNGILGISGGLLDGAEGVLPDTLQNYIRLIHESGTNLAATVDSILKLVQIEAKKSKIKFKKTNITPLIEEVCFLYSDAIQAKNNRFCLPNFQEDVIVYIEPDQIRTVLMNLLNNALKFTENGEIGIEFGRSGAMLRVSVTDTGIGIDEEKTDLVFEEFYQADGSHTRVYGGTGLGLAIAKKIVMLHGGRIWVESIKGKGSKFHFTLPMMPI